MPLNNIVQLPLVLVEGLDVAVEPFHHIVLFRAERAQIFVLHLLFMYPGEHFLLNFCVVFFESLDVELLIIFHCLQELGLGVNLAL